MGMGGDGVETWRKLSGLGFSPTGPLSFVFAHLTALESDKNECYRSHYQAIRSKHE